MDATNFMLFIFALNCIIPCTYASNSPNFVLMLADDAGIGDFGCYGNTTLRTPNIDRLATTGVKLTHHVAAGSVCGPSRAAFLTGRYQTRSGMAADSNQRLSMWLSSISGLPASEITFGELLQTKNYSTGYIGKWHMGLHGSNTKDYAHHPLNQGFDYFFGAPLSLLRDFRGDDGLDTFSRVNPRLYTVYYSLMTGSLLASVFLYKRKMSWLAMALIIVIFLPTLYAFVHTYFIKWLSSILMRNFDVVEQPIDLDGNLTSRLVGEAVQYLDSHAQQDDGRPFLLVVAWLQVHTPLHCSSAFAGRSAHGPYGDNVEELDWGVGQVVSALDRLNLKDNTLVYFSSDHGAHHEEFDAQGNKAGGWNGIYRGGKTQAGREGGTRVPGLISMPGRIAPGRTVQATTTQMDIYATMAELASIPLPSDRIIDGRSMVSLLEGQQTHSNHDVIYHHCGSALFAATYIPTNSDAVWKIHFKSDQWLNDTENCGFACHCFGSTIQEHNPPIIYDLASDPSERFPLPITDDRYETILEYVQNNIKSYKVTIADVYKQYTWDKWAARPWLQPVCTRNLPYLTCKDQQI